MYNFADLIEDAYIFVLVNCNVLNISFICPGEDGICML